MCTHVRLITELVERQPIPRYDIGEYTDTLDVSVIMGQPIANWWKQTGVAHRHQITPLLHCHRQTARH